MHQLIPLYITLLIFVGWSLVWKAIAAWHAAGRRDKKWFVAFFIFNTAGILELIYLFRIMRKPMYLWLIGVSLAFVMIFFLELAVIVSHLPASTY